MVTKQIARKRDFAADDRRRAVRQNAVKRPSVPVAAAQEISGDDDRSVFFFAFLSRNGGDNTAVKNVVEFGSYIRARHCRV